MAIGVNSVTEVEKLNIAMKFVAPVIASALLVVASSVGKPPWREKFVLLAEKPASAYVCRRRNSNGSRSGACALVFPLCHGRVPVPKSCAMSNFLNYVAQMNASVLQLVICK